MQDPLLWPTVNFWRGGEWRIPKGGYGHSGTYEWHAPTFPLNATLALQVLQTYPKMCLRRVYLHVINLEVLQYLTRNCPNLRTLSFFYTTSNTLAQDEGLPTLVSDDIKFYRHTRGANFDLNFAFPASILELQLAFEFRNHSDEKPRLSRGRRTRLYFTPTILYNIIRCYNLRHLTLAFCRISDKKQVNILILGLPNLQELRLLNVVFSYLILSETNNFQISEYMFGFIVNNMRCLKTLSFVPNIDHPRYNIEDSLPALSQQQNLTKLYINGAHFSARAFTVAAEGLRGLEELFLARCDHDNMDGILQVIARYFKTMKSLGLTIKEVNYDFSRDFKALKYVPSLKSVSFYHANGINCLSPLSDLYKTSIELQENVNQLFNILMTLPILEEVKGLGCIHMRNNNLKHILAAKPHIQILCYAD